MMAENNLTDETCSLLCISLKVYTHNPRPNDLSMRRFDDLCTNATYLYPTSSPKRITNNQSNHQLLAAMLGRSQLVDSARQGP